MEKRVKCCPKCGLYPLYAVDHLGDRWCPDCWAEAESELAQLELDAIMRAGSECYDMGESGD